jgi:DNA-binding NtrC family response regulator
MNKQVDSISNGAMRTLLSYDWPGNIRELANVIEQAMIFTEGDQITMAHIPFIVEGITDDITEDLKEVMTQYERQYIANTLDRHNNSKLDTAQCLGISLSTLYRKLDQLNIPNDSEEADSATPLIAEAPLDSDEGTYTAQGNDERQEPQPAG